jgi:hypothetical protein
VAGIAVVVGIAPGAGTEIVVEQLAAVEIAVAAVVVAEERIVVVIWVAQKTVVEVALFHCSVGQESAGTVETFGQQFAEEHQMPVAVLLETKKVVVL